MQSDRNSSKTDTFHKPITYKRHVQANNEQKTTFARHEYGRVGVFRIKISLLLPKLQPLEKCQFANCSHLIASHCIKFDLVSARDTFSERNTFAFAKGHFYSIQKGGFNGCRTH